MSRTGFTRQSTPRVGVNCRVLSEPRYAGNVKAVSLLRKQGNGRTGGGVESGEMGKGWKTEGEEDSRGEGVGTGEGRGSRMGRGKIRTRGGKKIGRGEERKRGKGRYRYGSRWISW